MVRQKTSVTAARVRQMTFARVRHAILGLIALLCVLFVVSAGVELWRGRQQTLDDAMREATNLTLLLQGHATGILGEIDILLATAAEQLCDDLATRPVLDPKTSTELQRRLALTPQVRAILVMGPDGRLLQSSEAGNPAFADVSDRDYFRVHAQTDSGALYIGAPAIARFSGKPFIPLSRRISAPDGTFVGVIAAAVDPQYFLKFFGAIDLGAHGAVSLTRTDGVVLAQFPDRPNNEARTIVASRTLDKPGIRVIAALGEDDVLRAWTLELRRMVAIVFIVLALVGFFGAMLLIQLRRLEAGERRFRDFAASASDWFWETDAEHRFTYFSDAMRAASGLDPAELLGRRRVDILERTAPGSTLEGHLADLAAHRPFRDFTYEGIDGTGQRRFVKVSGTPVFDGGGRFAGYRGTSSDITDQVLTLKALADAEADYRSMFENLPIGFYRSWPSGKQMRANPALVRLNGYGSEAEQIAGVNDIAREWYVDPDRRSAFIAILERDGFVRDFESEVFRHRTRERIWVAESARLHRGPDGSPLYYEGTVEDITARKHVEAALRERTAQLQTFIEHMSDGIFVCGPDLRMMLWNARFAELLEFPPSMIAEGATLENLMKYCAVRGDYGPGDPLKLAAERLAWAADFAEHDFDRRTPSGRVLHARGRPLAGGGFLTTYTDVTDRFVFENELRHAKEEAEAANRAKTEFLANMSHELRTPLNAILGFAEIIRDRMFGDAAIERYSDYAKDIFDSGLHLVEVIGDILDMSKIEAGRYELDEETLNLSELVTACIGMVSGRASDGAVTVEQATTEGIGPVLADRRALKQVLLNLLSNAVKFTEPGGRVTVTAARLAEGGIGISVTDTGIGIDAAALSRIFEPFQQADNGLGRRYEGTGLGLSISKRFMELHGGGLKIESQLGRGTTVLAWLPSGRVLPD